jgi:hypothetical protein
MHNLWRSVLANLAIILIVLSTTTAVYASAADEDVPPGQQLPHGYKTWSLFLVCNPRWIAENRDLGIAELYRAYKAFGEAIGPENVAIWFTKKLGKDPTVANTDIQRMATFCANFGLTASLTPQVIVTTVDPSSSNDIKKWVVNLNSNIKNSYLALSDLADQLLSKKLDQPTLDEREFWRRVETVSISFFNSAYCYLNKVSASINVGVAKLEFAHDGSKSCINTHS